MSLFSFQVTYVWGTKPLPSMVNVKSGLPALTFEGDKKVTDARYCFETYCRNHCSLATARIVINATARAVQDRFM